MRPAWPTVGEERALALRRPATWRRMSIIVQIVFFVLTIVAIASLYLLCDLLDLPRGTITLIASLPVAEILIRRQHFWRTGVESALWIGGLFAFIFGLPSSGKPEAILVFAVAAAIAGWRVRNALFGGLALVLITSYFAARDWPWLATLFAVVVALMALLALTRTWQRPSTDFLWQVLLLAMPLAGYIANIAAVRQMKSDLRLVTLFAVLSIGFAAVGVRLRIRAPLLSAAIASAIVVVEAHDYIPLSAEIELIIAGATALAVAATITRALRGKERGFVIGERKSEAAEALQIAAMLPIVAPAGVAPHDDAPRAGGGEFGGAGASGQY